MNNINNKYNILKDVNRPTTGIWPTTLPIISHTIPFYVLIEGMFCVLSIWEQFSEIMITRERELTTQFNSNT